MADYHSPTVIQQTISNTDITALERMLLTKIFDSEPDGDGLYFFAEIAPCDLINLPLADLRAALVASDGVPSESANFIRQKLKDFQGDAIEIDLDFSAMSWGFIFQDIVKRSPTLRHITAVTSFTCTKMRPDGFGGMAFLITADTIKGKSTEDILIDLLEDSGNG